jgi:hypothetical protein
MTTTRPRQANHQRHGFGKLGAHASRQARYGGGFYLKGLASKVQHLLGIKIHGVLAHGCIL